MTSVSGIVDLACAECGAGLAVYEYEGVQDFLLCEVCAADRQARAYDLPADPETVLDLRDGQVTAEPARQAVGQAG